MALPSLPSLPRPGRAVIAAGGLAHRVLSGGLGAAQSLVDRLPGAPGATPEAPIGANPQRRYGSRGSRDLAR